ncbi:MAG: glycosyltransferase family 2 protein [Candidatus Aureabacteria bacterium]|nr:glycosyltransferase family 2 protein [Candidatus Auribacterota bacterium]
MNDIKAKDFSVVVPVYNSEGALAELFERLKSVFSTMNKTFEVIFVNDCSHDGSYKVLKHLTETHEEASVISLTKNYGQQNALMCGFNYCSGAYVITIDDDLQNPPEDIPKLYRKILEGYDAVFGTYATKQHSVTRNVASYIIRKLNHMLFLKDSSLRFSSFRIIKKAIVDEIKTIKTPFPYISGMILTVSNYVANVEVAHEPRVHGKSSYSLRKLISLSFNLLINYSSLPLRLVGIFGLIISIFLFFIGGAAMLREFLSGKAPLGWTTIIVLLSFNNAIVLIALFIMGEYISRMLRESSRIKQYSIREILK